MLNNCSHWYALNVFSVNLWFHIQILIEYDLSLPCHMLWILYCLHEPCLIVLSVLFQYHALCKVKAKGRRWFTHYPSLQTTRTQIHAAQRYNLISTVFEARSVTPILVVFSAREMFQLDFKLK